MKPLIHLAVISHSSLLQPWQPLIRFLSLWICLFRIFNISGIIQYVTFCAWPLSLSMFSEVHPQSTRY